jgi:hypothetical protein
LPAEVGIESVELGDLENIGVAVGISFLAVIEDEIGTFPV